MENDIRHALGKLSHHSGWLQLWLTMLTGKPLADQQLPDRNRWLEFLKASGAVAIGVTTSWIGLISDCVVVVPLGWIASLHGMRYLQLVVVHNAAHWNFVKGRNVNAQIGFWISVALLIENFENYQRKHGGEHHNWRKLSTDQDPTVQALCRAGLQAGLPVKQLYLKLAIALFSPRYHFGVFRNRLQSYFVLGSRRAKLAALAVVSAITVTVMTIESPMAVMLAWVLPVTVLYQQTALLRLVVEHSWDDSTRLRHVKPDTVQLTKAIFVGDAPPKTANTLAWLNWLMKMKVALLIRLVILPGDSGPAHDWHHLNPIGDWPNYIAERDRAQRLKPESYAEIWGYTAMLRHSFESMSNAR